MVSPLLEPSHHHHPQLTRVKLNLRLTHTRKPSSHDLGRAQILKQQLPQGARLALQAPMGAHLARRGRSLAHGGRTGWPKGVDEGSAEHSSREALVLRGEASLRQCGDTLDGDQRLRQHGSVCGSCGFNTLRGYQGPVAFHG
ncbi:hypothetical protein V8G54_008890 [Vigna mungo]|uniref:Uncharacterized protein n=1 Tax=Vigna mungo TaxID=3915 RepID=A0AAQ3P4Y5_VIGMU